MSIKMTSVFKDNLAQLPDAPAVAKIVFKKESKKRKAKDEGGGESDSVQEDAGTIENKPGQTGSIKVYSYLMDLFGGEVTRQAAYFGCAIYAEHTEDALKNPGVHGNIDRLLEIISSGETLVGTIENTTAE